MKKRGVCVAILLAAVGCSSVGFESASGVPYTPSRSDAGAARPPTGAPPIAPETGGNQHEQLIENDWIATNDEDTSTFSIDVDTGSYTIMRREVTEGREVTAQGVRVEEYVNYFHYDYPQPTGDDPFSVSLEMAPSQFGPEDTHLLRIGLQGRQVPEAERLPANLVFLIDVSGSMHGPDRLPLVIYSLKELVRKLSPTDTLGIVVYAGGQGSVLEPTPVSDKASIYEVLDRLDAGGSTAGEAGIRAAYRMAESAFREGGTNRVILCTDGDFNVGLTGEPLIDLIEDFRERDITLTTLGYGYGNLNDHQLEQLADHGNGNYAYVDGRGEALRVLGENLVSTLQVIAKDVKVQVEFDPSVVARYRLVGYENRLLANDDFEDDTVDAGEIGAGHSVTALYEVELAEGVDAGTAATVRLRYKQPDGDTSQEITLPLSVAEVAKSFGEASIDFRFAAAVAELGEILRDSMHSTGERYGDVRDIVMATMGEHTDRVELLELVEAAGHL